MTIEPDTFVDLSTTRGAMRTHLFVPAGEGQHPAVIFYSEIYQMTGPIRRMAAALAGHGFLVAVPEVYHEFEAAGTVLEYDQAGTERGNELKFTKELDSSDEDAAVVSQFLASHPRSTGQVGSFGVCLGGHLAVRAGFQPLVSAVAAFYPTDIHSGTLGAGKQDDTLVRFAGVPTPFLFVWGRQDPHVPLEGRRAIAARLDEVNADYEWHEFNAAHAFLRDEGPRHNPAVARNCFDLLLRFFDEKLR
ncbi:MULTISPECIES: dienelactone hydrolase family protein [unclassified Lentimonas]|uniref:dienelactone hydrolase family protein n=1 Tax=unclassified Lentimonas TaxID=2630993 RepID=UPI0013221215|nr:MULTISPECIES: dienelactone hydrolase family protein [unclassified Lentimonas]CAA6696835.1 Candidate 1: dienelactone hydrolase [Lentimonas sp. CC10]CAA6697764.1 Candidate 1: dienelactone hydrolase [Lentimonas sp. CC19]CAA7071388.1 Candidate 1: dienelactone hydrolase [Lentimonas sp. CC11]